MTPGVVPRPGTTALVTTETPRAPIAMLAGLAIGCGLFFNGFNDAAGQALACIASSGLFLTCLMLRAPSPTAWRATLPVLVPTLAALFWTIAVWAGGADLFAPDLFGIGVLSYVGGVAALLAGWWMAIYTRSFPVSVGWLIALVALHFAIGLAIRAGGSPAEFTYWIVVRDGRFQGLIGNVNVSATLAGVTAILALTRLLARLAHGRHARNVPAMALDGAAIAISLIAAVATASRYTIVATLLLLAMLGALAIGTHRRQIAVGVVLASVGVVAVAAILAYLDLLNLRFALLADGTALRTAMWSQYLHIAMNAPIVGYGPESFPAVNAHFLDDPHFAQGSWMVNSAHNILLQLAITGGLPYLALLLWATVAAARPVLERLRHGASLEEWGIVAALLLMTGSAMVDIALDVPAAVTVALFLAGGLWGRALRAHEVRIAGTHRDPA